METITVQAIYEQGVLKPKTKLNLPEHSLVDVWVKPAEEKKESAFGSLLGIWSHLSDKEVADLEKNLNTIRRTSRLKVKKLSRKK